MSVAQSFARSGFARFMNSPAGRFTRLIAGLAFLALAYAWRGSTGGLIVTILGFILLAAGAFDLCLISALLGGPISGARVRKTAPPS